MRKFLIAALALVLIGAAAWYGREKYMKPAKTRGRVVTATVGDIEDAVEATGSVAPLNRVEIKPPIQGRIEELLIAEGASVQAGQILAWMSSSDRAAILDAARAKGPEELKRWQDSYKATPIVAPLSGVVILRNAVVGQTVESGTVLYAMSDTLIVLAQVDESSIGRIHKGMTARITLDSYPDRVVDGKVFDLLYEGKNVSNVIQYGVKVRPNKVPSYYRSQMTANIRFILGEKENAVLIPSTAIRDAEGGKKQVMVPGPDGTPVPREVKTGIESGEKVEILSGLAEGETVLLTQGRYVPQQAPQSSPLTFGGRGQNSGNSGQAPRPRRNASQ